MLYEDSFNTMRFNSKCVTTLFYLQKDQLSHTSKYMMFFSLIMEHNHLLIATVRLVDYLVVVELLYIVVEIENYSIYFKISPNLLNS